MKIRPRRLIPALCAGLVAFAANVSAPAAMVEGQPDTDLVPMRSADTNRAASLVDETMLIDYSAQSGARYFARRSALPLKDLIWDGTENLDIRQFTPDRRDRDYLGMSILELQQQLNAFPDDPHALMLIGVRLFQASETEQSIEALQNVIATDPTITRAPQVLSGILATTLPPDEAIPRMQALVDQFPDDPVVRFNTACVYARHDKIEAAMYHISLLAQLNWENLLYNLSDPDLDPLRKLDTFTSLQDALLQKNRADINRLLITNAFRPLL